MPDVTPTPDDIVQPFLIEDTGFRGRLIRLGPTVDEIVSRHDYPAPVAALLAEFLALTVALGAALKYDGVFSLQTKGDGPVKMMLADVTSEGELRGYASVDGDLPSVEAIAEAPVPRLLGAGHLAFTVDQGAHTDLYQGIVEIQGATLIECVHHYFRQSEQFSAAVKIAAGRSDDRSWRAGALMLQRLPGEEGGLIEEDPEDAWRRATILMSACHSEELTDPGLGPHDLLYRLFHEDGVRVFREVDLEFGCRCSRARAERVLEALPGPDLEEMTVEGQILVT
ncbi:MAG: Hsp33 family molecular chaperone HslO, partial [Alphaproteobacteria bacterium]|nr:Hsp33 family molecular chaperone HslO [Alphaproteobacteria bacterium]